MMYKECRQQQFCKDVRSHVGCGDPCSDEGSTVEMLANEVMANVYMFGSGRDDIRVGDGTCALIIA